MPLDLENRRMSDRLAGVIDDALDLADECGWRYAIAYLISEKVPSPIIQRLLFGGTGVRSPLGGQQCRPPEWRGRAEDDMSNLFESLGERRQRHTSDSEAPCETPGKDAAFLEPQWD